MEKISNVKLLPWCNIYHVVTFSCAQVVEKWSLRPVVIERAIMPGMYEKRTANFAIVIVSLLAFMDSGSASESKLPFPMSSS